MNALEKNQSKDLDQNGKPALSRNLPGRNQEGFALLISLVILIGVSLIAFAAAEIAVREREWELSLLTDLSHLVDDDFANAECGIVKVTGNLIEGQVGGARIETTYYVPPPNGFNWGDGDGSKVRLCHKDRNNLLVSINAVGDEHHGHMQHEGDYLGYCGESNNGWNTCIDRFGDQPRRLSWTQIWE